MANPKIQLRHDTAANWTSVNPVLLEGEVGIETDTKKFKVGDGVTDWTSLAYGNADTEAIEQLEQDYDSLVEKVNSQNIQIAKPLTKKVGLINYGANITNQEVENTYVYNFIEPGVKPIGGFPEEGFICYLSCSFDSPVDRLYFYQNSTVFGIETAKNVTNFCFGSKKDTSLNIDLRDYDSYKFTLDIKGKRFVLDLYSDNNFSHLSHTLSITLDDNDVNNYLNHMRVNGNFNLTLAWTADNNNNEYTFFDGNKYTNYTTSIEPYSLISLSYDNNTLKVNDSGQLYADVPLDKLNQSKALETGNVSNDTDVYPDILQYAHSTFDKSKFTITGSPTISDDGILDGNLSNTSNFVTANVSLGSISKLKIKGSLIYTNQSTVQQVFNFNGNALRLIISEIGSFALYSNALITSIPGANFANYSNKKLDFEVTIDGTNVTLLVISEDNQFNASKTISSIDYSGVTKCGIGSTYAGVQPYKGLIDLKSIAIWADGVPIFNGNKSGTDTIDSIEIPYVLSKTGSKIVDVAYRDKVQQLYEETGEALYYTIDEQNKNFTLPMGEIYGMIRQRGLASSTITETSRVDIYPDKTCLICGNVATAGTINLPVELANNNYFITLPASTKTATSFTTTATGDYILIGKVV